jgi:hypothetical protein
VWVGDGGGTVGATAGGGRVLEEGGGAHGEESEAHSEGVK